MNQKRVFLIVLVFFMLTFLASCNKEPENSDIDVEISSTESAIETEEEMSNQEDTTNSQDITENEEDKEIVEEVIDTHEGESISFLTGLYIDEEAATQRPFGISISNIKSALPQSGIGEAEVIYETLAEGGIPRLLAVFQDFEGEKIGPIRSARHYFLEFCFDFDAVYIHYGFSPQATTAFYTLNAAHIDGISSNVLTYQDEDRVRPHASFTTYDMLMAGMEHKEYRTELDSELPHKFNFSEEPFELNSSNQASKVYLHYSYYHDPWFEYNEEEQVYYRFQYDGPHIDDLTGEQLTFENIIIQSTDMWVIPGDTEGRLDMSLIASGEGYYITHGEYIKITWEKTSHESPTHYYDEDGNEIIMNPGKTWIAIYPSYNDDEIIFE
jgi:hypothetical protein